MTLPNQYRHACGTVAAAGDTAIIAAPGLNFRIVVKAFVVQNEDSQSSNLIQLCDADRPNWRCHAANEGDGLAMAFVDKDFWCLSNNAALNIRLSGATQVGYSVMYDIERI